MSIRARLGLKQKARPFSEFISFKETLKAAQAAGMSVGDFIESRRTYGGKTALQLTIDGLAAQGVYGGRIDRVCELGPGSGRYLEKTMALCKPSHYEIYESSSEWREWLAQQHPIVVKTSDWRSLNATDSASIDLVQAHKVFPGLPTLTTLSYLAEMARVARDGGWVVFDVMTEKCFDSTNLQAWFDVNPWTWDWSPRMLSISYLLDFFGHRQIGFIGSFLVPLYPGVTECLVFRKGGTSLPPGSASVEPTR